MDISILKRDKEYGKGDRNTGYLLKRVLGFCVNKYKIDILLAKYPPESFQKPHVDQSWFNKLSIHRLSIVLKKPESGGDLRGDKVKNFLNGRVNYFHASKDLHEVTKIKGNKDRLAVLVSFMIDKDKK